jgi:peptide/nickel transport system permease protein
MIAYIIRRFLQSIVVVIVISVLIFLAMRLLPGDPISMFISRESQQALTQGQIDMARHEYGLDKPLAVQYLTWIVGVLHGDLGKSLFYRQNVTGIILKRVPVTLYIGLIAFVISNFLGILTGLLAAVRRGKAMDLIVTIGANIGITMPTFWLGIMMIYILAFQLKWLPIMGYTSPLEDFWLSTKQIVMPVICLGIFPLSAISRQTRSSMLEIIGQDYIRTAWSKGLKERVIVVKHVLRNGLIPVITLSGMQIGTILGGAVIIETVFNISGMGRLAVDALFSLDYPVVQGVVLLISTMVVFTNFIVDLTYGLFDPRIRYV